MVLLLLRCPLTVPGSGLQQVRMLLFDFNGCVHLPLALLSTNGLYVLF